MDFKKAFVAVSVAFFTVIVDILFDTMYVFPIVIMIFLSYFLMKYYEEAKSGLSERKENKEADVSDIPKCNVEFFKSILKKKIRNFEKNRFLVSFVEKKVKELQENVVEYSTISLVELNEYYQLKNALNGKIFAKKGFFEEELKNFFDFLDTEGIKYSFQLGFENNFFCKGMTPVLVEVNFPEANLTERQVEIILVGNKYTGRVKLVGKLFSLRGVVEHAGGFFVAVREKGTKVFFGFAGLID